LRAQITLTVNEAKRIIAKGMARLPEVREALHQGRIFLKGGSTVSCVAEELVGGTTRISGRITPNGAKTARDHIGGFHCAMIEKGKLVSADESLAESAARLSGSDVFIIGANAIDVHGNAALMYGAPLGGPPAIVLAGLLGELPNVFIAAGLEKLVPGSLADIMARVGRRGVDLSMGMAVGLTPVSGRIISEHDAIPLLAKVTCTVIGRGGLFGAEGATTLLVEGESREVNTVFEIADLIKGSGVSGLPSSLEECSFPNERCRNHLACIYKKRGRNKAEGKK